MKKLFFLFAAVIMAASAMAVEKNISPNVCGITVGQTTKTGKTLGQWSDLLKDYRPMTSLVHSATQDVYIGDFVVEGFHLSVLSVELLNDTVYKVSLYENSPYADCWDSYKNQAFALRDKYAHFKDVIDPIEYDNDSAVHFFKTDGKTEILFSAYPNSISFVLINVHFDEINMKRMYDGLNELISGKTGPNYDEKNKVTSVAGIKFGESQGVTLDAFRRRGQYLKSEGNITIFSDVSFGGSTYSLASLYFQPNAAKNGKVFAAAKFEKNFYEWRKEEAKMMYDAVCGSYRQKYTNGIVLKDDPDSKTMVFGMLTDDYQNGNMPPIIVTYELGVSRGGDKFYYVTVSYFVMRMSEASLDDL